MEQVIAEVKEEVAPKAVPVKVIEIPIVAANGKFQYAQAGGKFFCFGPKGQFVGKFDAEAKAHDFCLRSSGR